tara:strand:+ start:182 stop:388 length:207 start_codon:yes stop_codon:yes gene_type:complete
MTLRELMKDIKESCTELELDNYLDIELHFFKLSDDENERDDSDTDISLPNLELICTSGSMYVDIGMWE